MSTAPTDLRDLICTEMRNACERVWTSGIRSVVLTGSLSRNEATFVEEAGDWRLLGDAEFLVILEPGLPLPSAGEAREVAETVERRLASKALRCAITLSGAWPRYLERLQPSIFAYELRECGEAFAGDRGILNLIPRFSAADIAREDAWRILNNRIVEHLGSLESSALPYSALKLGLDVATSFLVFVGGYVPTYRARSEAIRELASKPGFDWPVAPAEFCEDVNTCTRFKLTGDPGILPDGSELVRRLVDHARRLWRWEIGQLTGLDPSLPAHVLTEGWMRAQPVGDRIRGWLYVMREEGWRQSRRHYWRWLRYAWRASPRYWVYAVAAEILFADEAPGHATPRWHALRERLPVVGSLPPERATDRRTVLGETLWNYQRFLQETTA